MKSILLILSVVRYIVRTNMNYYKIIFSKVAYVKASDEEEARDMAMDEDYIFMDEDVVAVEPSCRSDIQKELNNWDGVYAEED